MSQIPPILARLSKQVDIAGRFALPSCPVLVKTMKHNKLVKMLFLQITN